MSNPDVEDGLDTEQNPDTGLWRWLWTSPNGASCIGLFESKTDALARKAGRKWATDKLAEIAAMRPDD